MIRRLLGVLAAVACLLAMVGQIVRDRPPPAVYLFYLPALHLGVACIALDGAFRGRTLRPRWSLFCIGVVGALTWLFVSHPAAEAKPRRRGRPRPTRAVERPVGRPAAHERSLAGDSGETRCSNARRDRPERGAVRRTAGRTPRSAGQQLVGVLFENAAGNNYWYRVAVLSRWPVRLEQRFNVPNGVACSIFIDVPGRPARLLAVDGVSDPSIPARRVSPPALARICDDADKAGHRST